MDRDAAGLPRKGSWDLEEGRGILGFAFDVPEEVVGWERFREVNK